MPKVKEEKKEKIKEGSMREISEKMGEQLVPFDINDIVNCKVISVSGQKVLCDVMGLTYGFVPEKEFSFDTKELKSGDMVKASVLSFENPDGFMVLSLRRADRDKVWDTLAEKRDESTPIEVKIVSANRGGLMAEAGGVQGFLPVSQLSHEHYPRVEGGDPNQILQKLRKLIGLSLTVKIIAAEKNEEKLIFSEKIVSAAGAPTAESEYDIGQEVECTISGIAAFGLFVAFNSHEGLVHISEVSWEHVDDLQKMFKVGQKLKAKIVKIDNGKISLSIKRLQPDPWINEMKKLRVGQKLEGKVNRVTAYGAFIRLPEGLDGLVHASSTGGDVEKVKALKVGDTHRFEVIELKPEARRIGLRLIG